MKRSANLLVCLGILVMGIVLAQANDGKDDAAPAKRTCCGEDKKEDKKDEKPPAGKAAAGKPAAGTGSFGPPYACLQYLVYEDDQIALWAADEYPDLPCLTGAEEVYLWTAAGKPGPQTCAEGGCEELTLRMVAEDPALSAPLAAGARYNDKAPLHPVPYPRHPDAEWNYQPGIKKRGEMQFDYVAVLGADGRTLIPLRLSAGIAEFDRVPFAEVPEKPKMRRKIIPIAVGFQTTGFTTAQLEALPLVTARPWKKYHPRTPTAFTAVHEGLIYHVTTMAPVTIVP